MSKLFVLGLTYFLCLSSAAFAGPQGSISFSEEEREQHLRSIQTLVGTASDCLDADLERQRSIYQKYGISPFYGDRSTFGKLSWDDKLNYLYEVFLQRGRSQEDAWNLAKKFRGLMEPTSCVGLVLKCLSKGFKAAGQENVWARIREYTLANEADGTVLQGALRLLGWRVLYWNPWTEYNERWDSFERQRDPENNNRFWGYHAQRWRQVRSTQKYYWNDVDDYTTLVNFGTEVPQSFGQIPFFVGTAHTGYHVFPGHYGNVVEGHSTRLITDPQTIESASFNPLKDGGAPRGQYYSGLIAVPPGY